MNPYKILESKPGDDLEKIKKKYRKLAKKHHPDTGGDADKFHEIQQAWEMLNNPIKMLSYDTLKDKIDSDLIDEVINRIQKMFITMAINEATNRKGENLIKKMIITYKDLIKTNNGHIDENEKRKIVLEKMKSQITSKLKNNIFHLWIDDLITQIDAALQNNFREISIYNACLSVLSNFDNQQPLRLGFE